MADGEDNDLAERARAWVVTLASGETSEDDLAALKAWLGRSALHARAFEAERAFWQRLAPLQATFERLEEAERSPLPAVGRLPRRRVVGAGLSAAAALAASLLLLIFAPEIETALRADYSSGVAAVRSVTLPDGSRATLDRDSAIAVDFSTGLRQIELLQGEAYFEVAPDAARPFRVLAAGGVSEAVGTAYAVRLQDAGVRVAVTEGRVAVTAEAASGVTRDLEAGQALRYREAGPPGEVVAFDGARALAWRQGKLVLVERPLNEALAELQRYHPGRIVLLEGDRPAASVSGVIDLDRLDEGIAALAATHGLAVQHLTPYLTVLR